MPIILTFIILQTETHEQGCGLDAECSVARASTEPWVQQSLALNNLVWGPGTIISALGRWDRKTIVQGHLPPRSKFGASLGDTANDRAARAT